MWLIYYCNIYLIETKEQQSGSGGSFQEEEENVACVSGVVWSGVERWS